MSTLLIVLIAIAVTLWVAGPICYVLGAALAGVKVARLEAENARLQQANAKLRARLYDLRGELDDVAGIASDAVDRVAVTDGGLTDVVAAALADEPLPVDGDEALADAINQLEQSYAAPDAEAGDRP